MTTLVVATRFPLETWKNRKAFSSQGILNRLEKSAKITQTTRKLRKFQTNIIIFSELCIICYMDQVFSLKNKTFKNYWKNGTNTGKAGNFVSLEKWEL